MLKYIILTLLFTVQSSAAEITESPGSAKNLAGLLGVYYKNFTIEGNGYYSLTLTCRHTLENGKLDETSVTINASELNRDNKTEISILFDSDRGFVAGGVGGNFSRLKIPDFDTSGRSFSPQKLSSVEFQRSYCLIASSKIDKENSFKDGVFNRNPFDLEVSMEIKILDTKNSEDSILLLEKRREELRKRLMELPGSKK